MPDTGGIRAVLLDGTANPPCVLTSKKFPTVIAAMQDLLDLTQTHLKFRNAVLYGGNASPNFACEYLNCDDLPLEAETDANYRL